MMKVLLKNELKSVFNTVRTSKKSNMIGYIAALIVVGVFLTLASIGMWKMSHALTEPIFAGLLSTGTLAIIGFILLLGVPQIFKDLYATGDLELLFTLPIKTKHIFWVKYLKSFGGVPLLAFVFFIVPLLTYGVAEQVHLLYYPVVILTMVAVLVIGLSIAYLFNLILIQVVPASRANEFLTMMSFFSGLLVYLLFMLPNILNDQSMSEMILAELPLFPDWLPMTWVSHAIVDASNGSIGFILPFFLIILLSIISVLIATSLVEKGFRTGWIRLSEGSVKKKKKSKRHKSSTSKLSHPVIAVGKKEWYSIKRDIREWIVLMPIVFFIIFGGIGFFSGGGSLTDLQEVSEFSWPIVQALFVFLFIFSSNLVASSAIGREGPSLWILKTTPLSGQQIALGKLWISWLLPLALLTVIEVGLGLFLGWTFTQFILGFIIKALFTAGLSSIGLWLGTLGAKYNPKNPQQRVNFTVSIFLFLASIIYFIVVIIPYAYIVIPHSLIDFPEEALVGVAGIKGVIAKMAVSLLILKANHPLLMNVLGVIVLAVLSLGIAFLFIKLSGRRIDKGINIEMVSESNAKPMFGRKKSSGSLY